MTETETPARSSSAFDLRFFRGLFVLSVLFIIYSLSNYHVSWMHPEVILRDIPHALSNGSSWGLDDLARSFDSYGFDEASRVRFVSYALGIANSKLRSWLIRYGPPHPSLSITWLFSLILSPILLFRMMRNITGNRISGWICLSLYFVSTGFLSGISMLFHPSKPLANFLAIAALYAASRVVRPEPGPESRIKPDPNPGWYIMLFAILLAAFFVDETAWFIFVAIPVLFPAVFNFRGKKFLIPGLYLGLLGLCLFFSTFIVPVIARRLGYGEFNFWQFAVTPVYAPSSRIWEQFSIVNLLLNGRNLICDQLYPAWIPGGFGGAGWLFLICFSCFIGYAACNLPPGKRSLFRRLLATLVLFIAFQSALLTKKGQVIGSGYYYGALFPVFWAMLVSLSLSSEKKLSRRGAVFFLPFLLMISAGNFLATSRGWIARHRGWFIEMYPPGEWGDTPRSRVGPSLVREIWRNRGDDVSLAALRRESARHCYPLFLEIEYSWLFRHLQAMIETDPESARGRFEPAEVFAQDSYRERSIPLESIRAASMREEDRGPDKLIDGDLLTTWWIWEDNIPTWLLTELEVISGEDVDELALYPDQAYLEDFFFRGMLFGSDDRRRWSPIKALIQDQPTEPGGWRVWTLPEHKCFRYYKLYLVKLECPDHRHYFHSMAELNFLSGPGR